ncbi:hypothetical protein ACU4GD_26915 [Cupriavidus basilensis]
MARRAGIPRPTVSRTDLHADQPGLPGLFRLAGERARPGRDGARAAPPGRLGIREIAQPLMQSLALPPIARSLPPATSV